MPIVFVGGVPFGGADRLARRLAEHLSYPYFCRDDIVAKANQLDVPVGKLEVAMVKKPAVAERLARLRDRYLAIATSALCDAALDGNLVYCGRAGHLLLPGVGHAVRVRVVPDPEQRLQDAIARTKLSRDKAERMLADIDEDLRAWVRFVHRVDFDDLSRYDLVVNLERISLANAATALCGVAELPDFRPTPASRRAFADLHLQARARLALALDESLGDADLTVRATDGIVTVTYVPSQAADASRIPEVLCSLEGCREVRCTLASSTILWIDEHFDPGGAVFANVSELARRWGAAVELLGYSASPEAAQAGAMPPTKAVAGVEDDVVEAPEPADCGLRATVEALVHSGRSGGGRLVTGAREELTESIRSDVSYSLVAVGTLFLDRPPAARVRMTRELSARIACRVKAPVVSADELGERVRFGTHQAVRFALAAAVVAVVYFLVFSFQAPLLDVLGGAAHKRQPWVAPLLIAAVAPLIAWLYGIVAASLLKLIRLE